MNFLSRARKPSFDIETEKRFRDDFADSNVASARLIIGQLLLVFLLAGYLDVVLLGELATLMVFLRYSVFTPIILLLFAFSFTPWFKKYMQLTFCLTVVVVSCYVSLFTLLNDEIVAMLYFSGVILMIFVSFVYVPILFNYALIMSMFVFSMSLLGLVFNESLGAPVMQSSIALLVASILLALAACYGNERSARLNFHYKEMLHLEKDSLEESNVHFKNLAIHDGLTGIANRRAFDDRLLDEWQRALRSESNLAILLIDVDFFKPFNDFYGHQVGDDCLQKIAQTLDKTVGRVGDFVARYGGEEFVIILPNADNEQAKDFAEKVRLSIANLKIPHEKSSVEKVVTLSIGVASVIPGSLDFEEADILLRDADRALYQAKSSGRNRVIVFSPAH